MAISGSFNSENRVVDTRSVGLSANKDVGYAASLAFSFSNGTGDSQGNKIVQQTRTLGGTSEDLDLTAMTDPLGVAVNFARIIAIRVQNLSTTDALVLGAASANPWTSCFTGVTIRPKTASNPSFFVAVAPGATAWVTGSSNKILKVAGANTQQYTIEIIGS